VTHRLLLDVSSMMYRAFFAMGETVAAHDGRPTGALHGYLDMVARLIVSRRPDEVVHAYDHDWRPVARTDIYAAYKANRPADPEALPAQFELLRTVLDLTGMTQVQTHGWEAEDCL
jgi:DNA polymerase-1